MENKWKIIDELVVVVVVVTQIKSACNKFLFKSKKTDHTFLRIDHRTQSKRKIVGNFAPLAKYQLIYVYIYIGRIEYTQTNRTIQYSRLIKWAQIENKF